MKIREVLLELLKEKAYRKGDFKLSSGKKSEHYVNCKPVTLSGEGLKLSSIMLLECIKSDVAAVAGLTLGADPLVSGVIMAAHPRNMKALIVRKEPKGHGTGAWIEGPLPEKGTKITVLEDVITTGSSSIKAVHKLRDAGYNVTRVVAIVDRQVDDEAHSSMTWAGLTLHSLFKLSDITN